MPFLIGHMESRSISGVPFPKAIWSLFSTTKNPTISRWMCWISHSPVVVWGNSVFAYPWYRFFRKSLQTGIESFSGFWSGSPLKVVGGKERFQVSSHPVFKKMGEGFLIVIWLRVKDCPPQKKIRTWFESRSFFSAKNLCHFGKCLKSEGRHPKVLSHTSFGLMLWSWNTNKRYEVAYLSVNITKQTRGCKPENWWCPVIHIDSIINSAAKLLKNTTWVMPGKKNMQKNSPLLHL